MNAFDQSLLPKVSLIVVTYLKANDKYLDLCLRSINNLDYPREKLDIILVSSGEYKPPKPLIDLPIRHFHSEKRLHFPEGVNFGVMHAAPDTQHLLLLNDDTILTKDSLHNLVWRIGDADMILQPISNCDNMCFYSLCLSYKKGQELKVFDKRFYRYDDVKEDTQYMMNAQSNYPPGIFLRDFVCFYATLIPKRVWDKVGPMDIRFMTGQDDCDYCLRAKKLGIPAAVELSSLIWHAGGVSADQVLTMEIRKANIEYYRAKHGVMPP